MPNQYGDEPTPKQKAYADLLLGNKEHKCRSKLLRQAGYSEAIVKRPGVVEKSQGFKSYFGKIYKQAQKTITPQKIINTINRALDNTDDRIALGGIDRVLEIARYNHEPTKQTGNSNATGYISFLQQNIYNSAGKEQIIPSQSRANTAS